MKLLESTTSQNNISSLPLTSTLFRYQNNFLPLIFRFCFLKVSMRSNMNCFFFIVVKVIPPPLLNHRFYFETQIFRLIFLRCMYCLVNFYHYQFFLLKFRLLFEILLFKVECQEGKSLFSKNGVQMYMMFLD